jgi:hypothetical protein
MLVVLLVAISPVPCNAEVITVQGTDIAHPPVLFNNGLDPLILGQGYPPPPLGHSPRIRASSASAAA